MKNEQLEFLDTLYSWKVREEIELEKLEEELVNLKSQPKPNKQEREKFLLSQFELDKLKLKIKHQEGVINRYKTTIQSYLFYYNI